MSRRRSLVVGDGPKREGLPGARVVLVDEAERKTPAVWPDEA